MPKTANPGEGKVGRGPEPRASPIQSPARGGENQTSPANRERHKQGTGLLIIQQVVRFPKRDRVLVVFVSTVKT